MCVMILSYTSDCNSVTLNDHAAFFPQLMDYKSSVNKETSVLDYLTRVIIKKCPHIAALEEDLKHVKDASRGTQYKTRSSSSSPYSSRPVAVHDPLAFCFCSIEQFSDDCRK